MAVALLGTAALIGLVIFIAPTAASAQTTPASPAPIASPAVTMAPVVVPAGDPVVTARAKDWLHRLQIGTIDRAQLSAQADTILTDDVVKQVSAKLGPLGDPTDFTLVDMRNVAGSNVYMYKAQFKSGALEEIISIDDSGKINGLRFLPAQ